MGGDLEDISVDRDEAMMRLVCAVEAGNSPVFEADVGGYAAKMSVGAVYDRAETLLELLGQGGCVFDSDRHPSSSEKVATVTIGWQSDLKDVETHSDEFEVRDASPPSEKIYDEVGGPDDFTWPDTIYEIWRV